MTNEAMKMEIEEIVNPALPNDFRVVDIDTANEALRRVNYYKEQKEERKAYVARAMMELQAKMKQLEMWEEKYDQKDDGKILYYEMMLEEWVRPQLEGKKKRSIELPEGKLGYKKGSKTDKDEKVLFAEVKKYAGEYIKVETKTVESVDLERLKTDCLDEEGNLKFVNKETGEVTVLQGYKQTKSDNFYTK